MRVLVTGSEGSLMQWTIRHLLERGDEVVGADSRVRYDDYDATRVVDSAEYEYHNVDLTEYDRVMDVMSDVDGVIDAAALTYGVKGFHERPADILSNGPVVHRNVLEGAREHGVDRVAYLSSSMVYETDEPPHHEDDVWSSPLPSTDYGLSKVVGERLSMAFEEQYDVDYTVWRPFNVITPYEKSEEEAGTSHVFADFLRKVLVERLNPMEIFGDGTQVRCFTWIDEVAEAVATWSFADTTANHAYNLANPQPVTMKELARRIFRIGKERGLVEGDGLRFDHVDIYDDDVTERVPSVERANAHLDWEPQTMLDDALERCIDNLDDLYEDYAPPDR